MGMSWLEVFPSLGVLLSYVSMSRTLGSSGSEGCLGLLEPTSLRGEVHQAGDDI